MTLRYSLENGTGLIHEPGGVAKFVAGKQARLWRVLCKLLGIEELKVPDFLELGDFHMNLQKGRYIFLYFITLVRMF